MYYCDRPWECSITDPHCELCLVNMQLVPCIYHKPDPDAGFLAKKLGSQYSHDSSWQSAKQKHASTGAFFNLSKLVDRIDTVLELSDKFVNICFSFSEISHSQSSYVDKLSVCQDLIQSPVLMNLIHLLFSNLIAFSMTRDNLSLVWDYVRVF